jgi:hypothetical protein
MKLNENKKLEVFLTFTIYSIIFKGTFDCFSKYKSSLLAY